MAQSIPVDSIDGIVGVLGVDNRLTTLVSPSGDYSEEQPTVVDRFIADCCHLTSRTDTGVSVPDTRKAYERWSAFNSETALSQTKFGRELFTRFGIRSRPSGGLRVYPGLELRAGCDLPEGIHE